MDTFKIENVTPQQIQTLQATLAGDTHTTVTISGDTTRVEGHKVIADATLTGSTLTVNVLEHPWGRLGMMKIESELRAALAGGA